MCIRPRFRDSKVFSIVSSSFLDEASIEVLAAGDQEAERILRATPRAGSMIIGPEGDVIAEAPTEEETIIYGDLDLARAIELKQHHDLVGYYNRFDIFELFINRKRLQPIHERVDGSVESLVRDAELSGARSTEAAE